MPPKTRGAVRRSQLVTTYGVGSVVAIEDESFMVASIDRWGVEEPNLHEARLERELNVAGFVLPPASEDGRDIPVVRFPTWYSCPKCRRLAEHRVFTSNDQNKCPECDRNLIPSRFVVACSNGHIEDFPYLRWVHHGKVDESRDHRLEIEAAGATASLADIRISCSCGAVRSMEGSFDRFALREIASCRGRRPWLSDFEDCQGAEFRTLQRGASNVWFSRLRSALSIPPWSDAAFQL